MPEYFEMPGMHCPFGRYWIVRPGDTLANIAYYIGISVSQLMATNPMVDPMYLRPGMKICLPPSAPIGPTGPMAQCPEGKYYTIQPGDTFGNIAYTLGTTANALMHLNPYTDPMHLIPGMNICIP